MINPLDLLSYIAITVILSLAIGAYIGVAILISAKVYLSYLTRVWFRRSLKPEGMSGLTFIVLISPLIGTMAYLIGLTAAN